MSDTCTYIDYTRFFKHCQKEFCSENLLFITLIAQWQHFLIKHKMWPKTKNGELNTSIQLIDSNVVINAMDVLPMLSKLEQNMTTNIDLNLNSIDTINADYKIFVPIIEMIYKKYIEMNRAPFEVNISFDVREKIEKDYLFIKQNKDNLNDEIFWQLWRHLLMVCDQVFEMIPVSLMRCFKNDRILTQT